MIYGNEIQGIFLDKDEKPQSHHRPDSAEKRFAMAMIADVVGEIDRYATGDQRRLYVMLDAIDWVLGLGSSAVSFDTVCHLLGWDISYARSGMLARLKGKPVIERRVDVHPTWKKRGRGRPKAKNFVYTRKPGQPSPAEPEKKVNRWGYAG